MMKQDLILSPEPSTIITELQQWMQDAWDKDKEKVGSEVRLGRVRPDDQRPSQSFCAWRRYLVTLNAPPPPEGAHQDTRERAGQAQYREPR